jgi:Flp pilus assembly protein TadD
VKRPKKRPSNEQTERRDLSGSEGGDTASGGAEFLPFSWARGRVYALLLVAITALAYVRAVAGDFVWDDDANITNNSTLRSLAGLGRIWFEPGATQQYYPLTHTSFWLEYHLWGLHAAGYHVTNIILHAMSAILFWRILAKLKVPGAWLAAALFAVHPVCVESVAWITERKNALAGVFYLGSLLLALKFWLPTAAGEHSRGSIKYYWGTLALFLCGMWCKTAIIGLPLVILLLVWWKRKPLSARDLYLLLPFVAVAVVFGSITLWIEKNNLGAGGKNWDFSIAERCVLAGRTFWFYLGKLAWPRPLMFMYPRWRVDARQAVAYVPLIAMVACILILWWQRRTWGRSGLVALAYFIVMLFPVMGFFNVYFYRYSFVCDHFQYLACMGPLALAAAGISTGLGHFRNRVLLAAPAVLLLALGTLTWRQTGIYRDQETLWRDTLAKNPKSSMAYNNLGNLLLAAGKVPEAIAEYQLALASDSDNAEAQNNLGVLWLRADRADDARGAFERALEIAPNYAAARANLASALLQLGRVNDAIKNYKMALELAPDDLAAHVNLGDALFHEGRLEEGRSHYERAIALAEKGGNRELAKALKAELEKHNQGR